MNKVSYPFHSDPFCVRRTMYCVRFFNPTLWELYAISFQTQLVRSEQGIVFISSDRTFGKWTRYLLCPPFHIQLIIKWTRYCVHFFSPNLCEMKKALCLFSSDPTCLKWTKYCLRFFWFRLCEMNQVLFPFLQIQPVWNESGIVSVSSDPNCVKWTKYCIHFLTVTSARYGCPFSIDMSGISCPLADKDRRVHHSLTNVPAGLQRSK